LDGAVSSLAGKPATLSGYGITNAYSKDEVDLKVTGIFRYRGSVSTFSLLPATGQALGDAWNVLDTGHNYAWDGDAWDRLAGDIDLTAYDTAQVSDTKYTRKPVARAADIRYGDWEEDTDFPGTWIATIDDEDITDGCHIEAYPSALSQDAADTAGIYAAIGGAEGSFTLRARRPAGDTVTIIYVIFS
jgi:hypothetical protein